MTPPTLITPATFDSFGELLTYLRKRAQLTQEELGRAVGYSRAQITRLEKNQRAPNLATLAARFLPALGCNESPEWAQRLLELAALAHASPSGTPAGVPAPPAPVLPLEGRAGERAALRGMLADPAVRLLTVTGPPGVGKTRLALEVAHDLRPHFPEGVAWVELAALEEPAALLDSIRQALDPAEPGSTPTSVASLGAALRGRKLLLVLDNFEHLLGAIPQVAALLALLPTLTLLVTSRGTLCCYGEHEFALEPLPLPQPARLPPLPSLAQQPAIALFVARARAARPSFELTGENAPTVARIIVALDGLPLAIELAASQLRWRALDEVEARLGQRLATLTGGARERPSRQRTLRGAIEWSYTRLPIPQQRFFARLGVLAGTFSEEAARAVGDGDLLADLVGSALVQRAGERAGEARFRLLETLREFALERLDARGGRASAHEAHARYFLALARRAERAFQTAEQPRWMARLVQEEDNLRVALAWSLSEEAARPEMALKLCVALWKFWRYRCLLAEGYHWSIQALAADQRAGCRAAPAVRAGATWGAGMLAAVMGQEEEAHRHIEASLWLWRVAEDGEGIAAALTALGASAMKRGDIAGALRLQREALALYEESADRRGLSYAHNALGETLRLAGEVAASAAEYEASLAVSREVGHRRGEAVALANLGQIALVSGERGAARERLTRALALFLEIDDPLNVATCLLGLTCLDIESGEPRYLARAARHVGAAEALLARAGGRLEPTDERAFAPFLATCRAALGVAPFAAAHAEGQALPLEQVVAGALLGP